VHGFCTGLLAGINDLVDYQVALGRRRRANVHRLVGHLDVQRTCIGIGIDRNGLDAHAPGRLDDAAGNLAAVGNQNFLEHARPCTIDSTTPELTGVLAAKAAPCE
jgi:hypothetical protein